jgi:hypothetical protein
MDQKNCSTRKFKSVSTGQECSDAQYIAEMVCIRRSERNNNGSLEYKFWNNSKNEEYQTQIRAASKLIKKFGSEAILHYLNSRGGRSVYSLGFLHSSKKFVINLDFVKEGVEKSKTIVDAQNKKEKNVIKLPEGEYKPRKGTPDKNTLMSKLRKADGSKNKNS